MIQFAIKLKKIIILVDNKNHNGIDEIMVYVKIVLTFYKDKVIVLVNSTQCVINCNMRCANRKV